MANDFIQSVNLMLAPFVGLVFMLLDYRRTRYTDRIHKKILVYAIVFTLAAMCAELGYEGLKGSPSQGVHLLCWFFNTLYFVFQVAAFGLVALFLDYSIHRDTARLKTLCIIVGAICLINVLVLTVNAFTGCMFTITPENIYARGALYAIRLCISYSAMLLVMGDLALSRKQVNKSQLILAMASSFPVIAGSTLDLLIPSARLIWPCFFVSLLFGYLFIVRTNNMIDSLTGVYNRRGCDEFLLDLLKSARKKDYAFIMIDMDRFKEINDHYGHARGDNALRDAATLLRDCVRRTDFVARYGGDEFVIVANTGEADKIAEKIAHNIKEFNASKKRPYVLAMSCGSGVYHANDARTPYEFLSYVDGVMYNKKMEQREVDRRQTIGEYEG